MSRLQGGWSWVGLSKQKRELWLLLQGHSEDSMCSCVCGTTISCGFPVIQTTRPETSFHPKAGQMQALSRHTAAHKYDIVMKGATAFLLCMSRHSRVDHMRQCCIPGEQPVCSGMQSSGLGVERQP